jgi:hypothetical protein
MRFEILILAIVCGMRTLLGFEFERPSEWRFHEDTLSRDAYLSLTPPCRIIKQSNYRPRQALRGPGV